MLDTPPGARPRPRDLPAGYHLAHFREMLSFVERLYGGILGEADAAWIADFRALDENAQSLLVRIANRKGSVFRTSHLAYADVDDGERRLADLMAAGFLSPVREKDFGRGSVGSVEGRGVRSAGRGSRGGGRAQELDEAEPDQGGARAVELC